MEKKRVILGTLSVVVFLIAIGWAIRDHYNPVDQAKVAAVEKQKAQQKEERRQRNDRMRRQAFADRMIEDLFYIKDPRTGLCFAYYSYGDTRYEKLAQVPENMIPPEMLIVANVREKK